MDTQRWMRANIATFMRTLWGNEMNREYLVVRISIYVVTGALLLMKFSKNLNKERGLKTLAEPEDDAEGIGQQ